MLKIKNKKKYQCKLCGKWFKKNDLSLEHYPARSVGNINIDEIDVGKYFDTLISGEASSYIKSLRIQGYSIQEALDQFYEKEIVTKSYPKGRTTLSLCRTCNTFLGHYDEDYKKFFDRNGNPLKIKGFQYQTKLNIIKSIFGKFLSHPDAAKEKFDFISFVRNEKEDEYHGEWKLFFIRRDHTTDIMGLRPLDTGSLIDSEKSVYEMSDEKFFFYLINHDPIYKMTNIFDILNKNYEITYGVDDTGGYRGAILINKLFK